MPEASPTPAPRFIIRDLSDHLGGLNVPEPMLADGEYGHKVWPGGSVKSRQGEGRNLGALRSPDLGPLGTLGHGRDYLW
jgi:hypothetical protein